jgi:hypothetical protein
MLDRMSGEYAKFKPTIEYITMLEKTGAYVEANKNVVS